jgi:drug/metabolite transporter (DMT)-like permease
MLKGFIVIFTALISYFFLNRKFSNSQKIGIFIVIIGLTLVGMSNIHSYNPNCIIIIKKNKIFFKKFLKKLVAPSPLLGNSLVIIAQFFLALMFVYEEKILKEYDVKIKNKK